MVEDNEDNGDLLQKVPCTHCCTQCSQTCSQPPLTHASAGDSWTSTGKSGSVSSGVTAPFSWVLMCTRFGSCPPRVCLGSGSFVVGLMATSSKRAYAILRSALRKVLPLRQATADLYLHRKHSNTVLVQSLWSLWVLVHTRFV